MAASPTRRTVLAAGGGLVLAGCAGTDADSGTGTGTGAGSSPSSASSSSSATSSGTSAPAGDAPAATAAALVQLADVPVGGAVPAKGPDGAPVVVAQPSAGTAVAFSAACTHQGCTVVPDGARLQCPCHGSAFDALTGAVLQGPAARPLPAVAVHVQDGAVVAGSA